MVQRIGILGGGQLGRMLALAAAHRGHAAHIFTPDEGSPASQVAANTTVAAYDDEAALKSFAESCDVMTYEFENVPPASLELLSGSVPIHPSPTLLAITRHRAAEKTMLNTLGIRTAAFHEIENEDDIAQAIEKIGVPAILKSSELGYDGKGQVRIRKAAELKEAWESLGRVPCILEEQVDFDCEASIIVARSQKGEIRTYELARNIHQNGILTRTEVPAKLPESVEQQAELIGARIAHEQQLVGVLAVELFILGGGEVWVNELAPRPHNSGHWTIEAAATSQFEQVIRAITGDALGDTRTLCSAQMINLIGDDVHQLDSYRNNPLAHIHLYGKSEPRAGRKMGHVTLLKPE